MNEQAKRIYKALFGTILIFALTFALLTGWFFEVFLGLVGLTLVFWLAKFVRFRIFVKKRNRDLDMALERQEHGIDVRFGRTGADRKKK